MDISGAPQLGPLQIQHLTHSAPIFKIWENLYQRQYTCTYLSVAEAVLKNLQALKCEVWGCNCVLLSNIL